MDNQEDIKKINSVGLFALIIGAIGVSVAGFGFYQGLTSEDARPLLSWLIGIAFWLSIALGVLFLTQIWYVFHARWPTIIRRQCEHCFSALPWLFLLFLPLLLIPFVSDNPGILWKWMDGTNLLPGGHELVQDDPLYKWKAAYLNPTFLRSVPSCILRSLLV